MEPGRAACQGRNVRKWLDLRYLAAAGSTQQGLSHLSWGCATSVSNVAEDGEGGSMRGSGVEAVTEEATLLGVSPALKEGQQTCHSAPSSTSLHRLWV